MIKLLTDEELRRLQDGRPISSGQVDRLFSDIVRYREAIKNAKHAAEGNWCQFVDETVTDQTCDDCTPANCIKMEVELNGQS